MNRFKYVGSSCLLPLLAFVAVACGGTDGGSVFGDGTSGIVTPPNSSTFGAEAGVDPNADGGPNTNDDGGACATTSAAAKLTPVNLVVMYDRSGSMGDTNEDPGFDPAKRWIPVGQATKAFFADPASAGISASLTFFPNAGNSCQGAVYASAGVGLTALPNAAFANAIDGTSPQGDTPTRAAVAGAIAQAQSVAAAHPNEKTVIVLVTDGEPYGCGINNANQSNAEAQLVAQDVAAVAATIPTYVIGVGPSVQNLNAVAQAGGTTAFQVQVGDPQKTKDDLLAAMSLIRGALGRCDFDIPAPPDGRTLDYNKVNVVFTPAGQAAQTLPYNPTCTGGQGWHFDDVNAPKKVLLCTNTCEVVKTQAGGAVDVAFSCTDRPDVIR